jgi:glycosyltransferase involved in cell wall biosynthesis
VEGGGAHADPRVSVSRSIFALVDDRDRAYFGRGNEGEDKVGYLTAPSAPSSAAACAAEPDALIKQLKGDEAIAEADTLLLTVPNQLGVDYNAHVIEAILKARRAGHGLESVVTLSAAATRQAETILGRTVVSTIPLPALGDTCPPLQPVPQDERIILAVGRLVPEKGFDMLIQAFAALADPTAELVIVGEGPDRARLEGLIARHGLVDRVQLPGYVSNTRGWLDKACLAAMPSRFEGYPAVLIEAFAAGRPAVATACTPATAELIDSPAVGRVVPVDDHAGMTAALQAMLASPPPDPATLAARIERHRIGPVARDYLALFQGLKAAIRP